MPWKTALAASASAIAIIGAAAGPANAAAEQAATPNAAAWSCYIHNTSGSTLNVRSGPGTRYTTIGTMTRGGRLPCGANEDGSISGQRYTACGGGDGWMTVRINGQDGWVAEECVSVGAG